MATLPLTDTDMLRVLDTSLKKTTAVEAKLNLMILSVSARVEKYLDHIIQTGTYTETFDVPDSRLRFRIDAYPMSNLISFKDDDILLDITDKGVVYDEKMGIVSVNDFILTRGFQMVEIQYTGGMAATTLDFKTSYPDISYEVALQVLFELGKMKNLVDKKTTIGDQTTERYHLNLQASLRKILKRYKRHNLLG